MASLSDSETASDKRPSDKRPAEHDPPAGTSSSNDKDKRPVTTDSGHDPTQSHTVGDGNATGPTGDPANM